MIQTDNRSAYVKKKKKKDLRLQKTNRALLDAIYALLHTHNFGDITISELCVEACISRATFYAHFIDKYDLLKCYLGEVGHHIVKDVYKYAELEREINHYINSNQKVITNIVKYANSETIGVLRDFMSSLVVLTVKRKISDDTNPHHIILFNFFVGGMVNLLTWIVDNNFPPEVSMMNSYFYRMVEAMTDWDAAQEQVEQ